jgi:hypothetical protein
VPEQDLPLNSFQIRELALASFVSEKTLIKALRGGSIRPLTLARIRRELANRGLLALLPQASDR